MNKKFLYLAAAAVTILTATDSFAYSNECVKEGSGSYYKVRCYDSNGNMTSIKTYKGDPDKGASASGAYTYTYDSNGKQTSYKYYSGDPDKGGSVKNATIYTYDSNGNRTSYKYYTFNSDGSVTVQNYTCSDSSSTACGVSTLISTETFTAEQYASILASISPKAKPKRTYYTPDEAATHVTHDNHNRVIFTFK